MRGRRTFRWWRQRHKCAPGTMFGESGDWVSAYGGRWWWWLVFWFSIFFALLRQPTSRKFRRSHYDSMKNGVFVWCFRSKAFREWRDQSVIPLVFTTILVIFFIVPFILVFYAFLLLASIGLTCSQKLHIVSYHVYSSGCGNAMFMSKKELLRLRIMLRINRERPRGRVFFSLMRAKEK